MTKFDPKKYQNKPRVYVKVPRANLVTRLWVWDAARQDYRPPEAGKCYIARRYEANADGKRKLKGQYFETLDEARLWQTTVVPGASPAPAAPVATPPEAPKPAEPPRDEGPTFRQVYEEWRRRRFPALTEGTRRNYERYIHLHFQKVLNVPVRQITPRFLDEWIDDLKANVRKSRKAGQRIAFKHELSVMRVVLKYYAEYHDDEEFRMPLKQRHMDIAQVRRRKPSKPKDLNEAEFWRFHAKLSEAKHGRTLAAMAVVQYFQALRVCEAAAVRREDVLLDLKEPAKSRLRITQHIEYPRVGCQRPVIVPGLKNDKGRGEDQIKELPLFPEAYEAIRDYNPFGGRGLLFHDGSNRPLTYRMIQHAYDDAFKAAELPYSGTHVLRHGGCRRVYNETGDLAVAQQLLGNSDLDSTLVYARRQKDALSKVALQHWERRRAEA